MKLKEWLESFYARTYGSKEEWEKAREGNKDIDAKMKRNEVNGLESWVCSNCEQMIVANINGNRAKMKVGKNTRVHVRFAEMAAYCENCGKFNNLNFDYELDWAAEREQEGKSRETFFFEERSRAIIAMPPDTKDEANFVSDYLLKLK